MTQQKFGQLALKGLNLRKETPKGEISVECASSLSQ